MTLRDIISLEQLSKLKKIQLFSHSKASIFFKKWPGFANFPRPAETDPYALYSTYDDEGEDDYKDEDDDNVDDVVDLLATMPNAY